LIGLVSLLPFILLSFYTVPNLEDYAESIIPGVWWHVKFLYLSYDGRFFTSFLFAAVNPLKIESYFLYSCIPLALMFGLLFSFYQLSLSFISNSKKLAFFFSAILLILFLNRNPNIPYSLYYMVSTYVYIIPSIFFLLMVSSSYKLIKEKQPKIYVVTFICFSIFAIAGGNELLLIPTLVWFLFLSYINSRLKAKQGKELSIFCLAIFCSYFIVFTSPGVNESIDSGSFYEELIITFKSLGKSISFTAFHIKRWLSGNYTLYISSLLFIYHLKDKRIVSNLDLTLIQKLSLASFLIISIFFTVFPYTWSAREVATTAYTQVFIIPYLFFTLFWFFILFMFTSKTNKPQLYQKQGFHLVLLSLLALSFILDKNSNVKTAYEDLWSKDAQYYKQEVMHNIKNSKYNSKTESTDKEIELCTLKHRPKSLYSGVYFNTKTEDFHLEYRLYYDIKKLKIVPCP